MLASATESRRTVSHSFINILAQTNPHWSVPVNKGTFFLAFSFSLPMHYSPKHVDGCHAAEADSVFHDLN